MFEHDLDILTNRCISRRERVARGRAQTKLATFALLAAFALIGAVALGWHP